MNRITRRHCLRNLTAATGGWLLADVLNPLFADENPAPGQPFSSTTIENHNGVPVRPITHGPKFHWFSYYDKLQMDPTGRFALGMEVDFDHRSPTADDVIKIGMIDLQDHDRWIELGESRAWCWQQGCMLQWRPGSASEILWNDRRNGRFVCHILDVKTNSKRTIEHPIYCVSPDGRTAMTLDFERIQDVRPGYGYIGIPDRNRDVLVPDNAGVYRLDLENGKRELVISVAQVVQSGAIPDPDPQAKHYLHHLLFNPDGSRFILLHRWLYPNGALKTRMFTAAPDGKGLCLLDDNGVISHFIWRDPRFILAESKRPPHGFTLYLFEDKATSVEVINPKVFNRNGHCNYLPGAQWILDDFYPDKDRKIKVFLYHVPTNKVVLLGEFYSPPQYTGEWRCDAHSRISPDGLSVIIDSPHGGNGRQMYLLDLRGIVDKTPL